MSLKENSVKPDVEETPAPPGGENEWEERGDHPLRNDLILDKLFGFVRRFDLKTCRLICKKWNLHTIPQMRDTFRVNIYGNDLWGPDPRSMIDHFVELVSTNELGIPFDSFQFGPFCSRDGVGQKFLRLCGDTAKEIDLKVDTRPSYEYIIEDVAELLRSCPNLKVLGFTSHLTSRSNSRSVVKLFSDSMPIFSSLEKITFHHGPSGSGIDQRGKYYVFGIQELLTAAPNISEIIVKDIEKRSGADNGDDGGKISATLNCIEKLGRESSIQSFHFLNAKILHIEQLRKMGEKENGLKLKNLTLKPQLNTDEDFGPGNIQLATIFKDTIQTFNVERIPENDLMGFPLMANLKSLGFQPRRSIAPKPTNLSWKFPALERLDIEFENRPLPGYSSQFLSQYDPNATIKSLSVRGVHTQINTFQDIRRVFTNLTKLDFRVGNHTEEILRGVWSEMMELKALSISIDIRQTRDLSLDSLFTGIPTQALDGIPFFLNESNFLVMTVQEKRETILKLTEQHSQLPSIRKLTKLRHLDLEVDMGLEVHFGVVRPRRMSSFTDLTLYLALYSMNHLRHVDVKRCLFTKTCCEIMTEDTGLESWGFRNVEYHNIIPPFVLQGHP